MWEGFSLACFFSPIPPDSSLVRWKLVQPSAVLAVLPMGVSCKGEGNTIRKVSKPDSHHC